MSAEALLISAVVDEGAGALRQVYSNGVTAEYFELYDQEWEWIERRAARKKPINLRLLREQFSDFEYQRARGETIADLAKELKEEVALSRWNQLATMMAENANKDNILDLMEEARQEITRVTRATAPMSDVDLDDWQPVIEQMRQRQLLAAQGKSLGVLTGIPHIDYYMNGFMPGQFTMLQGRTGSAKSYTCMFFGWPARRDGMNVGIFSPEFNEHEVRCRYHTVASADKEVQKACDLPRSFRNTLLMKGDGFNLKTYQRFMEYVHDQPGSMHLLCGAGNKEQMSVGYIEDRIVEYQLDLVIVDPIYLLKPVRLHREGNPYQEVAWIAEALHRVGEQYQVPIVFTNQSHLEGNKGDAPNLKDSWGTKTMLHICDWVLAVQHMSEENRLMIKANKTRFQEAFRLEATVVLDTGYFEVLTPAPRGYKALDATKAQNGNGNGHGGRKRAEDVVRKATGRKVRA